MIHFFETDLPLPIARKLQVQNIVPPASVRDVGQKLLFLCDRLGTCRLTDEERALVPVPVVDEWYRLGRSSRLHHFQYQLKFHGDSDAKDTSLTAEMFDQAASVCHDLFSMDYTIGVVRRAREDGMLVADLLLTRGLRRIEESIKTRLAELSDKDRILLRRRFTAIKKLRSPESEPSRNDLGNDNGIGHTPRMKGPRAVAAPRDFVALGQAIQHQTLREGTRSLHELIHGMKVPVLSLQGWEKEDRKEEIEKELADLRKATDSHAVVRARACLAELFPKEPWLAADSGVAPESLEVLLAWHDEFDALGAIADQLAQDCEDSDRVLWTYGKHLIRTLLREQAQAALSMPEDQPGRFGKLMSLGLTARGMHKDPPPKRVREWIRDNRKKMEDGWRDRLGAPPKDLDLV